MSELAYRIRHWGNGMFERARSRARRLPVVSVSTRTDELWFLRMMNIDPTASLFGCWILVVELAAKCPIHGLLADESGPFDIPRMAFELSLNERTLSDAIAVLCSEKLGLVEEVEYGEFLRKVVSAATLKRRVPQRKTSEFRHQLANNAARARAIGVVATLTMQEWSEILEACEWKCVFCGRSEVHLVVEHMFPLSRGGPHSQENVAPSCGTCNEQKGTRSPLEWLWSKTGNN